MPNVSASILACDHSKIGDQILEAERARADIVHIDVMDGVYVENVTLGPQLVSDLKKITHLPLSVFDNYIIPNIDGGIYFFSGLPAQQGGLFLL